MISLLKQQVEPEISNADHSKPFIFTNPTGSKNK